MQTEVSPSTQPGVYIIGDIHGQYKKLVKLLHDAKLVDKELKWAAGEAVLWFMGDFVDRGPDGVAAMDLVMRLQQEAEAANGHVLSLLGNHELLMLAAYRFGRRSTGLGSNFITKWKLNGGHPKELGRLTLHHLEWMGNLPAMARVGEHLFIHADAPLYLRFGRSVEEVNENIKKLTKKSDALSWEELLEDFARRGAFTHNLAGDQFARRFLDLYGGQQIIHGHTPISTVINSAPHKVIAPWTYASGLCVNVDGGMYLGGSGFVHCLSPETHAA